MRGFGWMTLAAAASAGCGMVSADACKSDDECVTAFGWGYTCGVGGACSALAPTDSCASAWPTELWDDQPSHRDALLVGSLIDGSVYGMERDAVRLAVDQVNDLGGIDGREVGVLECDGSALDPDARADGLGAIATFFTDARVPAVVGPISSSDAATVTAKVPDLVLVSPGASAIGLGGDGGHVWRTVPADSDLAQAMVRAMIDEGLGKAAIVHSREQGQTELATSLSETITTAAVEYPNLAFELFPFDSATERNSRVVDAAYAHATTVVFLSEKPEDYVEILLAAKEVPAYDGLVLMVGPAAYRASLLTDASAASALFPWLRGVRSATRKGAVADGFNSSFASAYKGADADQSTYAGQAYDSAWSVFSGMVWSGMRHGSMTSAGVTEGLGSVSFGLPLSLGPSGWNALIDQFGQAGTVDLDGASSPLDFDAKTHAIRGPVEVWSVQDGAFVSLTQYTF